MNSIPYFDRRVKHDVTKLHSHECQKYMALFLADPNNYAGCKSQTHHDAQNYFFRKFRLFLEKYYTLTSKSVEFDANVYFNTQHISVAGSMYVAGKDRSNGGRKQLLDQFAQGQKQTKANVDYMKEKYGIQLANKGDERLFLGHREPWWNPSPELLKKEGWEWVTAQLYCDETMATPLPEILDSQLIPLKIRNKVVQAWRKQNMKLVELPIITKTVDPSEDMPVLEIKNNLKQLEEEMAEMEW
jgi:hypothetical protein